jgi:hypothetical protein
MVPGAAIDSPLTTTFIVGRGPLKLSLFANSKKMICAYLLDTIDTVVFQFLELNCDWIQSRESQVLIQILIKAV